MKALKLHITGRNLLKLMINQGNCTSIITEIRMDSFIEKNKLVTKLLKDIRIDQISWSIEVSLIPGMTTQLQIS